MDTAKKYIMVFLISMLPVVELRGAVPRGIAVGLPFFSTYLTAAVGNMIPVPFILMAVKPVLLWLQNTKIFHGIASFFLEKGRKAGAKFGDAKFIALFAFVAIPMPGTGAWTGSLAAALLDLDRKKSFAAVLLGVLTAGIIMGIASYGVLGAVSAIFVFSR